MIQRLTALFFVAAALISTSRDGLARAPSAAAARTAIQTAYDSILTAMRRGDVAGAMSAFAPEFKATQGGRTLDRSQMQQSTAAMIAQMKRVRSVKEQITSFKLHGDIASVTLSEAMEMLVPAPDGRNHRVTVRDVSLDTWKHSASGWKCTRSITAGMKMLLDGKPIHGPR